MNQGAQAAPTPECDKLNSPLASKEDWRDKAFELERQRDEARAERDEAKEAVAYWDAEHTRAKQETATAQARVEQLRERVKRLETAPTSTPFGIWNCTTNKWVIDADSSAPDNRFKADTLAAATNALKKMRQYVRLNWEHKDDEFELRVMADPAPSGAPKEHKE